MYKKKYLKYKLKYLETKKQLGGLSCKFNKINEDVNAKKIFSTTLFFRGKMNDNVSYRFKEYMFGILRSADNVIRNFKDYNIRLYTANIVNDNILNKAKNLINGFKNEKWEYDFINNKLPMHNHKTYEEIFIMFIANCLLSKCIQIYTYDCTNKNKDMSTIGTLGTVVRFLPFFLKEDEDLEEIHIRDADQTFGYSGDYYLIQFWKDLGLNAYGVSIYKADHHIYYIKKNSITIDNFIDKYMPTYALCGGKPIKEFKRDNLVELYKNVMELCKIKFKPDEKELCEYGIDEIFAGSYLYQFIKNSYINFSLTLGGKIFIMKMGEWGDKNIDDLLTLFGINPLLYKFAYLSYKKNNLNKFMEEIKEYNFNVNVENMINALKHIGFDFDIDEIQIELDKFYTSILNDVNLFKENKIETFNEFFLKKIYKRFYYDISYETDIVKYDIKDIKNINFLIFMFKYFILNFTKDYTKNYSYGDVIIPTILMVEKDKININIDNEYYTIHKIFKSRHNTFLSEDRNKKKYIIKISEEKLYENNDNNESIARFNKLDLEEIQKLIVFYMSNNKYYYVYNFIEGKTLDEELKKGIDYNKFKNICIQILDIIIKLKNHGLSYIDITENNIIINKNKVYFIDNELMMSYGLVIKKIGLYINIVGTEIDHYDNMSRVKSERIDEELKDERFDLASFGNVLNNMLKKSQYPHKAELEKYIEDNLLSIRLNSVIKRAEDIKSDLEKMFNK